MTQDELIKLKAEILAKKGKYGLQRFERALDEIPNLHQMFSYEALREAFLGDNAKALMTMNPASFQDYAVRLPQSHLEDPETKERLKTLEAIKGFSDVPYLSIDKKEQGAPKPPHLAGHEGRHRSMALANKGIKNSLVVLNPRAELREPFPRREQGEYIDALRNELAMTNNMVWPEKAYRDFEHRPLIKLPDVYGKGGSVHGHAVDADGNPLDLYHGTTKDFDKFELGHPERKDVGWLGHGLYFTNSREMAQANAQMKAKRVGGTPKVMSVNLNLQNPYYATLEDKARLQKANSSEASKAFTEALKSKGHDGVIWKSGDYHEYVAFDPDQVTIKKAEGGEVDSDLKTAKRLGMDTSSIPEIRKAGQLREAYKTLGEKIREGSMAAAQRAKEYHESGKLPLPVGTRFTTEHSRKNKLPPFKVLAHYVDHKDPERYGYYVEQGEEGKDGFYRGLSLVSNPNFVSKFKLKYSDPVDLKAYWDNVQVLGGITRVKAKGGAIRKNGPVSLDAMRLALLNRPKMAEGGQPQRKVSPLGFYSPAAEAAANLPQDVGTPEQMAAMLAKNRGVTDEMQHSGYAQRVAAPKVSKQDLVKHFESEMPDVQETVLKDQNEGLPRWMWTYPMGDTKNSFAKFANLVTPGGTNYREMLLTLPVKAKVAPSSLTTSDGRTVLLSDQTRRDINEDQGLYHSSHWDQPNVLVHFRVNDRTDKDGKKVLFVEEIQSDWGQEGREKGFVPSDIDAKLKAGEERMRVREEQIRSLSQRMASLTDNDLDEFNRLADERQKLQDEQGKEIDWGNQLYDARRSGVPAAPFVTKTDGWVNLALKRIAKMAVDEGYDKVAFVNGDQSADRYDLSKQVGSVHYFPEGDGVGKGTLVAMPIGSDIDSASNAAMTHDNVAPEDLGKYVGKDLAKSLLETPKVNGRHTIAGEGLKVGGEGMRKFYDQIIPAALNKLLPRIKGKKLETVHLVNQAQDEAEGTMLHQPGFEITPEMREHVKKGLPIFKRGGSAQAPLSLPQMKVTMMKNSAQGSLLDKGL